jgi:hypothetical protein
VKKQLVDGKWLHIIVLPENPQSLLPLRGGWNPLNWRIAKVVDDAIRTGVVTEAGKYGFEYNHAEGRLDWNVYKIIED